LRYCYHFVIIGFFEHLFEICISGVSRISGVSFFSNICSAYVFRACRIFGFSGVSQIWLILRVLSGNSQETPSKISGSIWALRNTCPRIPKPASERASANSQTRVPKPARLPKLPKPQKIFIPRQDRREFPKTLNAHRPPTPARVPKSPPYKRSAHTHERDYTRWLDRCQGSFYNDFVIRYGLTM